MTVGTDMMEFYICVYGYYTVSTDNNFVGMDICYLYQMTCGPRHGHILDSSASARPQPQPSFLLL
jgi:hypothetical protein